MNSIFVRKQLNSRRFCLKQSNEYQNLIQKNWWKFAHKQLNNNMINRNFFYSYD